MGYCVAAAQDPARDYWCANHSIGSAYGSLEYKLQMEKKVH